MLGEASNAMPNRFCFCRMYIDNARGIMQVLAAVVLATFTIILLMQPGALGSPGWSAPVSISSTSKFNGDAWIALDTGGNPHVTWSGNDGYGSTSLIYYAENAGSGWSAPVIISSTSTSNGGSQIALDMGGNPHITWSGYDGSTQRVYFAENAGSGWSAPVNISSTSTSNSFGEIALDTGGNPHVTWSGNDGSNYRAYYSENTGGGWSAPVNISTTSEGNGYQQIALDTGGNPHIAWNGSDGSTARIYYSENTGSGWAAPVSISDVSTDNYYPQIALDTGGNPHVTWQGTVNTYERRIYYSENNGSGWSASVTLGGNRDPQISLDTGGNPHCTWTDGERIYYSANTNKGNTWYLAEGTNAWGFCTYITIENPNNQQLHARLTYMNHNPGAGKGGVTERTVTLPPLSQTTVSSAPDIGEVDFSTKVECTEGKTVAVDRTTYWTRTGAPCPEGHNSIGVSAPAKAWYLPEGSSNHGFETWTLVQNPNSTEANVTLTYMIEDVGAKVLAKKVPAYSRASYDMATDIGEHDSSIEVTSDVPVIAERSQYRNYRREGSCSIGANTPAYSYFLAEGSTAWGFTSYVLVQNPNDYNAEVWLSYDTPDGPPGVDPPPVTMSPNSRETIKVNDVPGLSNTDFSVHVISPEMPVVVERAMYWNGGADSAEACHDSVGLYSPHMRFYLPDGQTSNGWETYTLVQNPNSGSLTVEVTYLPEAEGDPVTFTDEIPANSRRTYQMADKLPSGRASIVVRSLTSARPIMVERSMYCYDRGLGTNTIGAFED